MIIKTKGKGYGPMIKYFPTFIDSAPIAECKTAQVTTKETSNLSFKECRVSLKRLVCTAFLCIATSTLSHAKDTEYWNLSAFGESCEIAFTNTQIGGGRQAMKIGPVCTESLSVITGWADNESGEGFSLFVGNTRVAALFRRNKQVWKGNVFLDFDGNPSDARIRMDLIGVLKDEGASQHSNSVSRNSEIASNSNCKKYFDNKRCAQTEDIGKIKSGALETLARMNIRFIPDRKSNLVTTIQPRSCSPVSHCTESFVSKEIWCKVKIDNFKSGWILKEDANFVYSRDGCG